jgi:hypothetical protein
VRGWHPPSAPRPSAPELLARGSPRCLSPRES